jgi:ribosomal protein S27E
MFSDNKNGFKISIGIRHTLKQYVTSAITSGARTRALTPTASENTYGENKMNFSKTACPNCGNTDCLNLVEQSNEKVLLSCEICNKEVEGKLHAIAYGVEF